MGRNGTFDIVPDLSQWAVIAFSREPPDLETMKSDPNDWLRDFYGGFMTGYWKWSHCETWSIALQVVGGHGTWDGASFVDATLPQRRNDYGDGPLAVLTRATIRPRRLRSFWRNVPPVSREFFSAEGVRLSVGIGELPLVRQATFSLWDSGERMKDFAYRSPLHRDVIARTRSEGWYSEEMFLRFRPLLSVGSLKGRTILSD